MLVGATVGLVGTPRAHAASGAKYFSMNLHCALGDWQARVDQVIDELLRSRPDVAGFQEVCRGKRVDMAKTLVDSLKRRGYPVQVWRSVDTHTSFLWYQEQLLLLSWRPVDDQLQGELPSMAFFQNRFLGFLVDGQWVVTTHLNFLLGFIRGRQHRALAKLWSGRPTVMMGDFNSAWDSTESRVFLAQGWTPHFAGPTYPSDKPSRALDGFWASPALGGPFKSAQVRRVFEGAASQPSDHLGVELTVDAVL